MFFFHSISLLFHRNNHFIATAFDSAILFGFINWQIIEIKKYSLWGSEATPFGELFQGGRFAPP